jgi:spore maturation protein SpmB
LNKDKPDPTTILLTDNLIKPSKGETVEAEKARVKVADILRSVQDAVAVEQGLVNSYVDSKTFKDPKSIVDTAATWFAPFGTNIVAGKVGTDQLGKDASLWQVIKAFAAPGSTIADMRDKLANVPATERIAMTKSLLDSISAKSGLIFSDENQINQMTMANDIVNGQYTTFDKWMDNFSGLLDAVGVGFLAKGAKKAAKAEKIVDTAEGTVNVGQGTEAIIRPRTFEELQGNVAGQQDRMISKLESEKAGLMGDAGNKLDRGAVRDLTAQLADIKAKMVPDTSTKDLAKEIQKTEKLSYKAATSEAERRIQDINSELHAQSLRIEQQIESNRKASTAEQRIASIEKEIEQIRAARADVPGAMTPIADLVRRIEMRSIVSTSNPASPAILTQQVNPEKSRALFHATFVGDDAVAQAMYGTNRIDAIAGDVFPQIATESGKVSTKPVDMQRTLRNSNDVPQEIIDAAHTSGALEYTDAEKAQARAHKVNDFKSAAGLEMMENMSSFRLEGNQHKISAVYGTPEGSFINAEQAVEQTINALRHQGITEGHITVLRKEGLDHVPVPLDSVRGIEDNYLVRVDAAHNLSLSDITLLEHGDVKRNWFDALPTMVSDNKGSLSRWMFDASSMLHPIYTSAAVVASDKAAKFEEMMLKIASRFSDRFTKLDNVQKARVDSYIREANAKRLPMDTADLLARGMGANEIASVKAWREFWDGHYYLENFDMIRTLDGQGYQKLISPNADLFARKLESPVGVTKVYDPTQDLVVTPMGTTLSDLYNNGGYVARLRRPTQFGADTVEHVIVRNNSNEYLRKLSDTDQALNYIEGYYQIQYKAPRFIDEIDANGMRRAIAVGGDTKEAEAFAARMRQQNPDLVYQVRGDDRAMRTSSDDWFDINSASGRIAQRHRGKLLEDSTGLNLLGEGQYVVGPVDSAIHAARSVAGRTVGRPVIETAKARFMEQFKHLELPSDGMGGQRFPRSLSEIGAKGRATDKDVADARTVYEWIHYLENGYINTMDETMKALFNSIANGFGKFEMSKAERAVRTAADFSVTNAAKSTVVMSFISANPLRQWIVQPHQAIRMWSYNPTGTINGQISKYVAQFGMAKMNALQNVSNDVQEFVKFVDQSGLLSAVDKQNLVRGTLLEAADNSNKIAKAMATVPNTMRRIGFDMGEYANTIIHSAAVFEKYKREGKDVTKLEVMDQMHSEIRALSYDMNHAGDMPYNQTTPAFLLQFMQIPHKALLQATNRRLDPWMRGRLVLSDTLMWGVPGSALISHYMGGGILPDNPQLRESFVYGIESMLGNEFMRWAFKDDSINVDFSSLAPYDMQGWASFFKAMFTDGVSGAITNSATGSLLLKDGSRMQTAIQSVGRFFGVVKDDYKDHQEALSVINDVLSISSGWSNAVKAHIALETGKVYDKYGNVIDQKAHPIEAVMIGLGFPSANQRDMYQASKAASEKTKDFKDEVEQVMDEVSRYYQRELSKGNTDIEYITKVSSFVLKKYENNPEAQAIAGAWMNKNLFQNKEQQLIYQMMKAAGIPEGSSLRDNIRQMPVSEDQKQMMLQRVDDVEKAIKKGE